VKNVIFADFYTPGERGYINIITCWSFKGIVL